MGRGLRGIVIVALALASVCIAPAVAFGAEQLQDVMAGDVDGLSVDVNGSGGYFGESVRVTFDNATGQTVQVENPVGLRLQPDKAEYQTMVTSGGNVIDVPPGQHEDYINAFCGEYDDEIPEGNVVFEPDGFVRGELLDTVERIVDDAAQSSLSAQWSIWFHTDGYDISGDTAAQDYAGDLSNPGSGLYSGSLLGGGPLPPGKTATGGMLAAGIATIAGLLGNWVAGAGAAASSGLSSAASAASTAAGAPPVGDYSGIGELGTEARGPTPEQAEVRAGGLLDHLDRGGASLTSAVPEPPAPPQPEAPDFAPDVPDYNLSGDKDPGDFTGFDDYNEFARSGGPDVGDFDRSVADRPDLTPPLYDQDGNPVTVDRPGAPESGAPGGVEDDGEGGYDEPGTGDAKPGAGGESDGYLGPDGEGGYDEPGTGEGAGEAAGEGASDGEKKPDLDVELYRDRTPKDDGAPPWGEADDADAGTDGADGAPGGAKDAEADASTGDAGEDSSTAGSGSGGKTETKPGAPLYDPATGKITIDVGGVKLTKGPDGWGVWAGEDMRDPFTQSVPEFDVQQGNFNIARDNDGYSLEVGPKDGKQGGIMFDPESGARGVAAGDANDRTALLQLKDRYSLERQLGPDGKPTRTVSGSFDTESRDFDLSRTDGRGTAGVSRSGSTYQAQWDSTRGDSSFVRRLSLDTSKGEGSLQVGGVSVSNQNDTYSLSVGPRTLNVEEGGSGFTFTMPHHGDYPVTVGAGDDGRFTLFGRTPGKLFGNDVDYDLMVNNGMRVDATENMMPQVTPDWQKEQYWVGIRDQRSGIGVSGGRTGDDTRVWLSVTKRR